ITVVGNTAGRFAALKSGAADAAMVAPPFNFFAEDAGFRTLAMIRDSAPDLPFAGMDVSLAYAEKHEETLKHLIAAIDKAIAWFDDDRNRDEAIAILADEMHADPKIVGRSYDLFRKIDYFARGDTVSRKGLENLIREMRASGDLETDIAPERI